MYLTWPEPSVSRPTVMPKVTSLRTYAYAVPLRGEFRISLSTANVARGVIVEALDDDGFAGYGEAAPFSFVVGTTAESTVAVVRAIAEEVVGLELSPWQAHSLLRRLVVGNGDAKAAVEAALLDLHCRRLGRPLCECLGGHRRGFETDVTIGIKSVEETLAEAERRLSEGFTQLKVKVGESPENDVARVKALRERLGFSFRLRVDANQGWTLKQALRAIRRMERYEVELVEQPLPYWDLEGLRLLRRSVEVPIALDESVHTSTDAVRALRAEAADIINIKIMKAGGILEGLKVAHVSEAFGVKNMVGCMLETRLGVTMGAHLVCLTDNVEFVDLDSDLLLAYDPVSGGVENLGGGRRRIPDRPGLGVEVDKSRLELLYGVENRGRSTRTL